MKTLLKKDTLVVDDNNYGPLWISPVFGSIGWKAARAAAASRLVPIVGYGDSKMEGYYSSSFANKGYFGKLITDLQALYGDGGAGFISVAETAGLIAGSAGRITATGSGGVSVGGFTAVGSGINGQNLRADQVGATLTFTGVRGTAIDIYWLPTTAAGSFSYNIDSTGAVTVTTGGGTTGAVGKTTITGLSAGNHTVVLTSVSGLPQIFGMTGRNAVGIIGHNMGLQGRISASVVTAAATGLNAGQLEGVQSIMNWTPDLLILDLGTNDIAATNPTPVHTQRDRGATAHSHTENTNATYVQNATTGTTTPAVATVRGYSSYIRHAINMAKANNSACEIVLINPHQGKSAVESGTMDPNYTDYASGLYSEARQAGGAVLDCMVMGRHHWGYWNSLGYWGTNGSNSGVSGTDERHPGDVGHAAISAQLLGLLTRA